MDTEQFVQEITPNTKPVLLIRVLGFKALTQCLLEELAARNGAKTGIVWEAHCGKLTWRKLETFGLMSRFSFCYAHHMGTIEGRVVSKNDRLVSDAKHVAIAQNGARAHLQRFEALTQRCAHRS